MVRRATGPAVRSAASVVRRSSSARDARHGDRSAVLCRAIVVQRQGGQHRFPRAWSNWPPLSSQRPARGNRDASLSARAVHATPAAARRVGMLRGNCSGSGHQPAATIQRGESARIRQRSTAGRGHNGGRSVPVVRSAHNCRADSSLRPPSCSPHAALDNATRCGHKGSANASSSRASMLKARGSFERVPGPSLIRRRAASIAQPQWGHAPAIIA
jgi:hypothetical protein